MPSLHLTTSPVQFQILSHELSVHIILFQALFTLFSKFFWVFLHSTSSLSVFLLYLGFDEYYHLFNLYFQINLLFSRNNFFHFHQRLRGFHSPWPTFPSCSPRLQRLNHPVLGYTTIPVLRPEDQSVTEYRHYQLGLFLFHSPLLKKSLLFSFPSLIDMLKLRESSYRLQINIVFESVLPPVPDTLHRIALPFRLTVTVNFFKFFYTDIEAYIYPSRKVYCHAFKTQHFALYRSCCLSQFIAFFIDQETKLSRALFFSLFYRYRYSNPSVKNLFIRFLGSS